MDFERSPSEPLSNHDPDVSDRVSDHALLQRLRAGDRDAATAIFFRYAHRLRALTQTKTSQELATRLEPEDIVQSVFRSFFRRAEEGLYDVPEGQDLWNLFMVITLNKIRLQGKYHHAGKRDIRLTVRQEDVDESSNDEELAYRDLKLVMEEMLGQLAPKEREIVELRIQGFDVAEIAAQVKRSKRTVERVLQEFRGNLHRLLDSEP